MERGYQSYRGRRSKGRIALIAVLLLVVAVACGYMFIQRYVVYTDDGGWHFDVPFLHQSPAEDPPAGGGVSGDGEDTGGSSVDLVVDPLPPEEHDEPERPYGERHLIALGQLPAGPEELAASLQEAGANGFLYNIRDDTGRVFYDSAVSQAQAAQRHISAEAITALCSLPDTVAVARFNCFHDSYYASVHMEDAGICQASGYIWSDEKSYYWLDPAKEAARRYVIDLALECVQMGFDELLLEELAYPAGGDQSRIDYSGDTLGKSEALALFLTELREALEGQDVRLSLLVTEQLLQTGADETSGQDLAVLVPLVDAVYVPTGDSAAAQAMLAQYAGEGQVPELVPMTAETGEGHWCLTMS